MSSNNMPSVMSSITTPVDTVVTCFSILTNVVNTDIVNCVEV